uniref:Uncharacterized protein n=1 Tax=Anguilla anguilla TaxID=7936 RepID=A0A0E9S5X5_ANGAN
MALSPRRWSTFLSTNILAHLVLLQSVILRRPSELCRSTPWWPLTALRCLACLSVPRCP